MFKFLIILSLSFNVDVSHGSFEIELPNVTEETDMKQYFKVRNKLLSRTRSLVNKYFKSEPNNK